MIQLEWLDGTPANFFPNIETALTEPDGLLAAGGDLSPERLLAAYSRGIFPWYSDDQPILWWSPNPRMVIEPSEVHIAKRMRRFMRQQRDTYQLRFNTHFSDVISACAESRMYSDETGDAYESGTWITNEMHEAYCHLHELGHAHCLEVWRESKLVAGIYGIARIIRWASGLRTFAQLRL